VWQCFCQSARDTTHMNRMWGLSVTPTWYKLAAQSLDS